eukprot:m.23895 g.23895  ORF g.23895 m.23895 type:complete len:117 (-) comp11094_c0_seq1:788-1138(-)
MGQAQFGFVRLLQLSIEAAITFYTELVHYVQYPFLIAPTWAGIRLKIKENRLSLTPEGLAEIQSKFESMRAYQTVSFEVSIGNLQMTKTSEYEALRAPDAAMKDPSSEDELDIDAI